MSKGIIAKFDEVHLGTAIHTDKQTLHSESQKKREKMKSQKLYKPLNKALTVGEMIFIMLVCSIYNNVWTGNLRPMVGQISTIYKIHQNDTKLIKNKQWKYI